MMHPKGFTTGRRVAIVTVRVVIAVGLCVVCAVWSGAASYASGSSTPGSSGQVSPWQHSRSSSQEATLSAHRPASVSTRSLSGRSSFGSASGALRAEEPTPTPRLMDNEQYAALLLVGGFLCLTQAATMVLIYRSGRAG
jgi:hypothetical protein